MKLNRSIESLFEECLQQLQAGDDLEKVLSRYPRQAKELRPLLEVAYKAIEAGKYIIVPSSAQKSDLAKFMSGAKKVQRFQTPVRSSLLPRLSFALLVVIIILFLGGYGVFTASARTVPGDPLYPVKISVENTQLRFARDPIKRLELVESFEEERLTEIEEMTSRERSGEVTFVGGLSKMDADQWLVANVNVLITTETQISGDIQPGYQVEVHGILQPDGRLVAELARPHLYQFSGVVESIQDNAWVISGITVILNSDTIINGPLTKGTQVKVESVFLASGALQAIRLEKGSSSVVTPINTSEPPERNQDQDVESTPAGDEGGHDGVPESVQPTDTPENHEEINPSATPKPHEGDDPTEAPQPTHHEEPTHTPAPTETHKQTESPHPSETHKTTETPED